MLIKDQIFREYDIRGVVGDDLSDEFAFVLGRAYATLAKDNQKNNIVIGFDCRLSSPGYAESLAKGIAAEGLDCTIIGMGPTPQVYWTLFNGPYGGGIMVTGSHNPSNMNGFKICLGKSTLSGEQIQDLKRRVIAIADKKPTATTGKISKTNVLENYINNLAENCASHMGKRKLRVVVDAGNGVGGMVGPQVLKKLGVEVIELFCDPDGRFPNHHPDPTVMENLEDLIHAVKQHKADFGIGWDGDADRIGAVDENGKVIFGDMLLLIYARSVIAESPGATVIGDVKCSSLLFEDVARHGGKPVMWKTGHSLIKNKLKELHAELGGEMSGHIFFGHRFFGFDDALYCSARLCELMSKHDGPISSLIADLPKRVSTPEIRLDCPEEIKFKIPELAKKAFGEFEVSTLDGVRISFPQGWGLVRASNTQPVLVMRFEADTPERLKEYQDLVTGRIEKLRQEIER